MKVEGNMKKLVIAFIITCLVSLSSTTVIAAASAPKVLLNGTEITFANKPIIVNNTTMVPFRNLLESLNAKVDFDVKTQTIKTTANNTTIQLVIGEKVAVKNGQIMQLAQAPYVKNNVTYVPLRFISEAFGYGVDIKNNIIYITASGINASSPSSNKPTLTVQDVAKLVDRVAYIELYNSKGKLYGSGSGVVVDSNGGILTNYHVIEAASKAIVHLGNKKYETKVILKHDEDRDLALIKIEETNLPVVDIGNSSTVALGESVVALGAPLGYSETLTTGVISNVFREMYGENYIQTTAPIDHGSSGGALFNMKGELIGITTAVVYSSASLNFAIPSDDVKKFLNKPSQEIQMVGVTKSGIDKSEIIQKLDELFNFMNDNVAHLYNDDIGIDVAWLFEYDYDKDNYKVHAILVDYDQYVKFVHYISRHSYEMGDVYEHVFGLMEDYIKIKNVEINFAIAAEITTTPDYSLIDSSVVENEDGYYRFLYYFSQATRKDNLVLYNTHHLVNNQNLVVNMN